MNRISQSVTGGGVVGLSSQYQYTQLSFDRPVGNIQVYLIDPFGVETPLLEGVTPKVFDLTRERMVLVKGYYGSVRIEDDQTNSPLKVNAYQSEV